MTDRLSVAVVIASLGRPDLIDNIVKRMDQQSRKPDLLLFAVVTPQDLPEGFASSDTVTTIFAPKGSSLQRNAALDHLGHRYDIIIFYDDDFVPSRHSIANVAAFFQAHPEVAGANGIVLADGINTPGISTEEAERIVALYDQGQTFSDEILAELVGLYGCNMAYRSSAIGSTRFDERLRHYAWQEDVDFAKCVRPRGKIVITRAFAGVHQGLKHGRTSGRRLGYSQVVNPLYLVTKGTMPASFALKLITKNLLANHIKMFTPEPWVDRKGRAGGNWIGLRDVLLGKISPERVEKL